MTVVGLGQVFRLKIWLVVNTPRGERPLEVNRPEVKRTEVKRPEVKDPDTCTYNTEQISL